MGVKFGSLKLLIVAAVIVCGVSLGVATKAQALGAPFSLTLTTFAAAATSCPKPTLLGIFVPWFQYLTLERDSTGSCAVKEFNILPGGGEKSDFPLVLLAIVDDMLRLAGLVAVIFVIYGGIMYATSQGNPEATAKAQSTVINALIGLVVALFAVVFVNYVGRALGV